MFPTELRSSPRSMRSSTRIPDSSVATRVSYGAAFTTMSLLAFCIGLPAAAVKLRRHLPRDEILDGQGNAQQRRRRIERPNTLAGPLEDCNENPVRVHPEIADERFQVRLDRPAFARQRYRVAFRGAERRDPHRGGLRRDPFRH